MLKPICMGFLECGFLIISKRVRGIVGIVECARNSDQTASATAWYIIQALPPTEVQL